MDAPEFYNIARRYDINALGCTAQAALETGWFSAPLMLSSHNYWGIKCTPRWRRLGGRCFNANTWEEKNDVVLKVKGSGFALFDSDNEALTEYSSLIRRLYRLSYDSRNCVWLYIAGLSWKRKWASDRKYIEKLAHVAFDVAKKIGISKNHLNNSLTYAIENGLIGGNLEIISRVVREELSE